MFFESVFKSPYPFAFSLPVLCQEQFFIYKNIKNSDQPFIQGVRASFCHRFSELGKMLKFFHYINFRSVAWRFQYLLKYFKFRSESNSKTGLMLIYGISGICAHKKTMKQLLQPMIEQVWGGGGGWMCCFSDVSFSELLYFCVGFFQFTDAFLGSILQISAYLLLYTMCISSKSQTVFWQKIFVIYN